MNRMRAFVAKEFRHILRDRWTMIILLALPVVMLVLFGFAVSTDLREARFAYYDSERSEDNRRIVERLDASEYFALSRALSHPAEAEGAFRSGEIALFVEFSDGALSLAADGVDPNMANSIVNYAAGIIGSAGRLRGGGSDSGYRIQAVTKLLYNPRLLSAYNFVPGVMGMILMLICSMMTSISIAREKEKGTMEVLLVSPMRPLVVILAKAIPYLAVSALNLATIIAISVFVLGVPVTGSLFWLVAVSVVYIFTALALGLLISSVANSQAAALLASGMGLMLPVMILSGMIFPVDQMPALLRWISALLPARWYIAAVRKLMVKGLGLESILTELSILVAMAVLLTAAGLKKFKVRLE